MKNFEYIVILGSIFLAAGITFYFCRRLKIYHFYRLIRKAFIKKSAPDSGENYLPTYYLFKISGLLIKAKANSQLVYLCGGRSKPTISWLKENKYEDYALILEAIEKPEAGLNLLEKFIKKHPDNRQILAELAILYFLHGDKIKAKLALDNFKTNKKPDYAQARKYYLQAYLDMNDGNMLGASQNCSLSTHIFHKLGCDYEEGQSYLLMGIIYRVAIVSDVAQMMFNAALEIFNAANCRQETAAVYGNLGMLMAIQKRFEEAADYYQKAETIYQSLQQDVANAEIFNQKALLNVMQNEFTQAEKFAKQALKIHQNKQNSPGIAFSKEILGNIAWNRKDYQLATQMAFEAKNLYKQHQNLSAYLENMYLMALCLFEQNNLKEAEKALRDIAKAGSEQSSSFHLANAYNLLGLIYLKQNDLRRAKGLFQQSLNLEQANNRLGGIATDYANIGLVEWRCGNEEQARKTLETALEYAEADQEQELADLIRKRLEQLSVN